MKKGFTIIEALVVASIIMILSSLIYTAISYPSYEISIEKYEELLEISKNNPMVQKSVQEALNDNIITNSEYNLITKSQLEIYRKQNLIKELKKVQ